MTGGSRSRYRWPWVTRIRAFATSPRRQLLRDASMAPAAVHRGIQDGSSTTTRPAPELRDGAGRRGGAADRPAHRRSVPRGRGDGRVSPDRGRDPAALGSADDRSIFLSLPSYWGMNEIARAMSIKPLTAGAGAARRMSDLPALHRAAEPSRRPQAVFPSAVLLDVFNLLDVAEEVLTLILACVAIVVVLYSWSRCTGPRGRAGARSPPCAPGRPACDRPAHRAPGVRGHHRRRRRGAGLLGGHALAYLGAHVSVGEGRGGRRPSRRLACSSRPCWEVSCSSARWPVWCPP